MTRIKRKKQPIVPSTSCSTSASSCRKVIRQYHSLLKKRHQIQHSQKNVRDIDLQISSLGGLGRYQQLSLMGQRKERGGGTERVFINWMKKMNVQQNLAEGLRLCLLEVGALKPDNYASCRSWVNCKPIDLRPSDSRVVEQDFFLMDTKQNKHKWDAISLSLVLNFVPLPRDRGRMLQQAYNYLIPQGLLFLALPLPCVANSRYLDFVHLKLLMESIGFIEVKEQWRKNGRMGYWLYRKHLPLGTAHHFAKKSVLRQGHRNNFAIILN